MFFTPTYNPFSFLTPSSQSFIGIGLFDPSGQYDSLLLQGIVFFSSNNSKKIN